MLWRASVHGISGLPGSHWKGTNQDLSDDPGVSDCLGMLGRALPCSEQSPMATQLGKVHCGRIQHSNSWLPEGPYWLYLYDAFIDVCMMSHPLHPWDSSNLVMVYDLFSMLFNSLWNTLLENPLHLYSLRILVYSSRFCWVFIWFWCQNYADFAEWISRYSFLFYRKIWGA